MSGAKSFIFSSNFLMLSTVGLIALNVVFFPDLLNNKDIKLYDMSYLITPKETEHTKIINPGVSADAKLESASGLGKNHIIYNF